MKCSQQEKNPHLPCIIKDISEMITLTIPNCMHSPHQKGKKRGKLHPNMTFFPLLEMTGKHVSLSLIGQPSSNF